MLEGLDNNHIGMDSAVIDTKIPGVKLVQTTDFFYPNVDDPYLMGKIACANVLSDLYAMGVDTCDNMLMILGVSQQLMEEDKPKVVGMMLAGFKDLATEAATFITGGQTVKNPWFILGGVATSVISFSDLIMQVPVSAQVGDVLVLTKPLGTQVAVNAHLYLLPANEEKWKKISGIVSRDQVCASYDTAIASMSRLNRTGAILMKKYGAHAATDVTGFGLLGHAKNLVSNQHANVDFVFHTLPVIKHMYEVDQIVSFRLSEGFSAETSGGLLVVLPKAKAMAFCEEMEAIDGWPSWIVGDVLSGTKDARLSDKPRIVECEQHSL